MTSEGHSSAPGASVHENHYCSVEGCGKWGGLGHSPNKATPITWWCFEHFPHDKYSIEARGLKSKQG